MPAAALIALLAVQVIFGVHYIAAKFVVSSIPPPAWATVRVICAALVLVTIDLMRNGKPKIPRADMLKIAVFSFFGVSFNQVLFTEGLARTTPAHSALIITLIPISTFLFAVAMRRETTTLRKSLGIATAFTGILILLRVESFSLEDQWVLGDIFTLSNACSFGFFLVISRNLARRYKPLTLTAWTMAWGAVGVALYGWKGVIAVDPSTVAPLVAWTGLWIILFPTVIAYLLNFYALAQVESSTVALFIYIQPLLATLLSVGMGQENLTPRFLVSALFVFTGVFLVARGKGSLRGNL